MIWRWPRACTIMAGLRTRGCEKGAKFLFLWPRIFRPENTAVTKKNCAHVHGNVRGCAGSRPRARARRASGARRRSLRTRRPPSRFRRPQIPRRAARRARASGKTTPGKERTRQGKGKKSPKNKSQTNKQWKNHKQKPGKLKKKTRCESRSGSGGKPRDAGVSRRAFRVSRRSPAVERGVGVGVGVTSDPVALRGFCGSA